MADEQQREGTRPPLAREREAVADARESGNDATLRATVKKLTQAELALRRCNYTVR